ncbi:MAG: hypothetical protein KF746_21950 [Chitinophagaceae bacterium]|nr:hypothetical protein [Chitinophagaceae bacterium]
MPGKFRPYHKFFNRHYLSFFVSGFLVGLLFYFYCEDKYEQHLFRILSANAKEAAQSKINTDSNAVLISSLELVNKLIASSRVAFQDRKINTFKSDVIDPLTVDLMTGQGACGSYSMIMARILKDLDVDVRLVQMKVDGEFGGHIILEAKQYNNKWAVFDPSYNLYFKRPDGSLASFDDVESNWNYYKNQVPEGYDMKYRYEDKQYTNWEKIPVIMPLLKKTLDWTLGKENADTFSLRTIMLRKFNIFFTATLVLLLCVLGYMAYYIYKKQRLRNAVAVFNDKSLIASPSKTAIRVVKKNPQNTIESPQD